MGHLHAGHMSLIKNAENFSKNILVSIYVNEAQFNDPRDFENYPRTLEEDIQKLRDTKCKFLITPKEYEIKNISKAGKTINIKKNVFICLIQNYIIHVYLSNYE